MTKPLYFPDCARSNEQRQKMVELEADGICLFCEPHIRDSKRRKNPILHKNFGWKVTANDYPYEGAMIHLMLIANRHVERPSELSGDEWQELQSALSWIEETYSLRGGSLVMRFGDGALTQSSIAHLHAHLIVGVPRDPDDQEAKSLKVSIGTMAC